MKRIHQQSETKRESSIFVNLHAHPFQSSISPSIFLTLFFREIFPCLNSLKKDAEKARKVMKKKNIEEV